MPPVPPISLADHLESNGKIQPDYGVIGTSTNTSDIPTYLDLFRDIALQQSLSARLE